MGPKKKIGVTKRVVQCAVEGCLCTCDVYYVTFNAPHKPGNDFTSNRGSFTLPTRGASVCSPEHALVKLQQLMVEEGELLN